MSDFTSQSPWTMHHTEDGTPYYYNNGTEETQWYNPDALPSVQVTDASGEIQQDLQTDEVVESSPVQDVEEEGIEEPEDLDYDEPESVIFSDGVLAELEKKRYFSINSIEDDVQLTTYSQIKRKLEVLYIRRTLCILSCTSFFLTHLTPLVPPNMPSNTRIRPRVGYCI